MKIYNKLVRDKIPEIISSNTGVATTRILDNTEYLQELNKKLLEELQEYLADNNIEELADIVEVIYAILDYKKTSIEEFEQIRKSKANKRGAFSKKIFLEKVIEYEKDINKDLVSYIEKEIFPLYNKNEAGHQINHIKLVINKSLEYASKYDVDINMVYTIAAYHDLGHHIDKNIHEIVSAEIFIKDENIKQWFTDEQRVIIKEAIEDHRASNKNKPRSLYGLIVSAADRSFIDIEDSIKRTYLYGLRNFPDFTEVEQIERIYKHLNEKFGQNGYVESYIEDKELEEKRQQLIKELSDKATFIEKIKRVIKE